MLIAIVVTPFLEMMFRSCQMAVMEELLDWTRCYWKMRYSTRPCFAAR
jgi:hypothetical protein